MTGINDISQLTAATAIQSTYAHYIIFGCGIFGLIWGVLQTIEVSKQSPFLTTLPQVNKIELKPVKNIVNVADEEEMARDSFFPWTDEACLELMKKVN